MACDAALPVSNGSESIAPRIAAAAVSKIANRSVLPVGFISSPLAASRKQRVIGAEFPRQYRSRHGCRRLESRTRNRDELSRSYLPDLSRKGFEQTFIDRDLNVPAKRKRYLGVVTQC